MNSAPIRKLVILLLVGVIGVLAGKEFRDLRYYEDSFVASAYLTEVTSLSAYEPSLRGTWADAPVYVFDSGAPGGTAFFMGGAHPNESAGILSAYVLMESIEISKGRVIVLPIANLSASTASLSGFGYPSYYHVETDWGIRMYKIGSRVANPLDQWPDPPIFVHYPSGQNLCYEDSRNINRNYPGRTDGSLTERVGWAIMALLETEHVDFAFDIHEASITYPVNDTYVAPDISADIAFLSSLSLGSRGIDIRVELSADSLKGYSHREWGMVGDVRSFLIEAPTPFIERVVGPMTGKLVRYGKDEFLVKMADAGYAAVPYDENGYGMEYRCGLQLSAALEAVSVGSIFDPDAALEVSWPGFEELAEMGIGHYLHDPDLPGNHGRVQYVGPATR
jgi:hypothetical protein